MTARPSPAGDENARKDKARAPIVLVTHEFFPARGGAGVYVHELARAAGELGYDVRVLAPGHPRWRELDLPVGLEALAPVSRLRDWRYYPAAAWHLIANRRRIEKQVLHLCQQSPLRIMLVLRLLGLVRPRRLVVTLHGSELLQLSASLIGGRWLLGRLLDQADRVAVLSRWVRGELLRHYPGVADKVVVAPGAPRAAWPGRESGSHKAGSRLTLLTVGRIHPRKGQRAVLEALGRLDDGLKARLRYVIVGPVVSRSYARTLRRLASATGVEVLLTGEVEDAQLAEHYAAADIFAMTSERQPRSVEGFGLAYLEASASGLPVAGYRSGGVEDAVQDGVTGLLIPPGDVAGLAAALTRLIQDAELRARLGANGREWAARFSWERCARAVYGGLL